jgi:hypothetical protein
MTDTTVPRRLRRAAAADYLQERGIPITEKTLANRNAGGLGPFPEYLGTIPFYRVDVLNAWLESAFTPESPVTVTRRKAAAQASVSPRRPTRRGTAQLASTS